MASEPSISEVFAAAADYALSLGALSIKDLPGCWESQVDAGWWIALNGHADERPCSRVPAVPPYSLYVEWYGWPAGIVNARGGTIAAGSMANEDTLIAALRKATGDMPPAVKLAEKRLRVAELERVHGSQAGKGGPALARRQASDPLAGHPGHDELAASEQLEREERNP